MIVPALEPMSLPFERLFLFVLGTQHPVAFIYLFSSYGTLILIQL